MPFQTGFVTRYLDPLEVEAEVSALAAAFPALCRLETLPNLSHGYAGVKVAARGRHSTRVLRVTGSGGGPGPRPVVLLLRSPHAREWINPLAAIETARQLVENYRPADTDPEVKRLVSILDRVEFLIIAESNPDGVRLSFFDPGQRMWRKNLRPPDSPGGCAGVDCNRNYPRYFGEAGSSGDPCAETYRGPSALSEPETANVAYLASKERTLLFAVDSHSFGESIFRPNPAGGTFIPSEPVSPADEATYAHLEQAMNRGIRRVRGVEYSTGSTSNHAGASDEYLFFDHHVFGFDLECGQDFQPPTGDAVLAAREVAEAVKALGWCAAGETGLDIAALLAARAPAVPPPAPVADADVPPWDIPPLPPYRWRRFRVRLDVRATKELVSRLADEGFDVEDEADGTHVEVVASAADLERLLRMGYHPTIVADLFRDGHALPEDV